mgnify:CR=1 FL=1
MQDAAALQHARALRQAAANLCADLAAAERPHVPAGTALLHAAGLQEAGAQRCHSLQLAPLLHLLMQE